MKKLLLLAIVGTVIGAWAALVPWRTGVLGESTASEPVSTVVKIRADKQAIVVDFRHRDFSGVLAVNYNFTYYSGNPSVKRGVSGTFAPDAEEYGNQLLSGAHYMEREMVLGTCSKGACVYDTNTRNLRLDVMTIMSSGLTFFSSKPVIFPRS